MAKEIHFVGDKVRVVKDGSGCPTSDPEKYQSTGGRARLEVGEVLTVEHVASDGTPAYSFGGNKALFPIPIDFVEPIGEEPSSTVINKGDWVRAIRDVTSSTASTRYRYFFGPGFLRKGEVFRVKSISRTGLIIYGPFLDSVERQNVEPTPKPDFPTVTVAVLSLASTILGGVSMSHLLNDPIIHYSIRGLVAVASAVTGYLMVYHGGIVTTAKSFAKWGNYRREVKRQKQEELAVTIAKTFKELKL